MSGFSRQIRIDVRPQGPLGPWADLRVGRLTVRERLLAHAAALGQPEPQALAEDSASDLFILRSDRLYHPGRLARAFVRRQSAEQAVLWRLDSEQSFRAAEDELARRLGYQPIGRFWAFTPARWLARTLAPTLVRPNAVTLAAATVFLGGCACVAATATWPARLTAALLLALALVLDTADGHLARLQGTCSDFGRWLDAVLDELCDVTLHAAIAWFAFTRDGSPAWLLLGIVYAGGKHVFQVAQTTGSVDRGNERAAVPEAPAGPLRSWVRMAGHADIRWHLWIVLTLIGRLEWALIAYAPYYPARAIASALSRRGSA